VPVSNHKSRLDEFKLSELIERRVNILIESEFADKSAIGFVIALAQGYNDLKDVFWLHNHLIKFEHSLDSHLSAYNGQYGGMTNFCLKKLVSIAYEFVDLLVENPEVMDHESIRYAESRMKGESLASWNTLKRFSKSGNLDKEAEEFRVFRAIERIRNNVGYHYHGIKNYYLGFDKFVSSGKNLFYVSYGQDMASTRFYFADAATEYRFDELLMSYEVTHEMLIDFIRCLNLGVRYFVESFVESQNTILNGSRPERKQLQKLRGYK
jgi:hypothetical protein